MATMSVEYSRKGDVHSIDTGAGALGGITVDFTDVPAEQRGGVAKQLLGASALFCYCSALVGALEARGARFSDVHGKATLHVGGNDLGQGRVKKIDIEVQVSLPEEDEEIFTRCAKIMKQGCLVTGSLHDGIEMAYDLKAEYGE